MTIRVLLATMVTILLSSMTYAAKPPVFSGEEGAINGYDPVAYFVQEEPLKGSDQHTFEWAGAKFKFVSENSLAMFKSDPEKYLPQYGGYCAFAVSKGATATTVPEAWSIVDDKLYLNYSLSVRERWRQNIVGNIQAADNNWPDVLK